jgi:hypothetical protein
LAGKLLVSLRGEKPFHAADEVFLFPKATLNELVQSELNFRCDQFPISSRGVFCVSEEGKREKLKNFTLSRRDFSFFPLVCFDEFLMARKTALATVKASK